MQEVSPISFSSRERDKKGEKKMNHYYILRKIAREARAHLAKNFLGMCPLEQKIVSCAEVLI